MKITDIETHILVSPELREDATSSSQDDIVVLVHTDEGITGWGEITNYPGNIGNRAIQKFTTEIKDFLVGRDRTRIKEIWARAFQLFAYTGTRGATTAAIRSMVSTGLKSPYL